MTIYWPTCAKCNKEVDEIAVTDHGKRWKVWCHGEETTMPRAELLSENPRAFTPDVPDFTKQLHQTIGP